MKRQSLLMAGCFAATLTIGWLVGRNVGIQREPAAAHVLQLDSRTMQLLLQRDSGSAATSTLPSGKVSLTDSEAKPSENSPDIEYFPQAIESAGARSISESKVEQEKVWDESLAHLEPQAAHEILALKSKLGSVAATSFGLNHLQPTGVEPAVLQLPNDGTIKAVEPSRPALQLAEAQPSLVKLEIPHVGDSDITLEQWRDIERHNARHASLPGFKRSQTIDLRSSGRTTFEQRLDLNPGIIEATNNPFDIAIEGEGWFVVVDADATQYLTRCGLMVIDEKSQLAIKTERGPLPLAPAIVVSMKAQKLIVDKDGTCRTWSEGQDTPTTIGKVKLGSCLNPAQLRFNDDGLYVANNASGAVWTANAGERGLGTFRQGALERSNAE